MGIWRVLKATIYCDNCEKLIASMEFDAADEPNIERIRVWCTDCRKVELQTNGDKVGGMK
jgi:phage FluMu protein Com